MTAQSQDQREPLPGTVFTPRQVRILKIAVIVMGIALVGGFALLIAGMVHQASQIGKSQPSAPTGQASPPATPPGAVLKLAPGQTISHMSLGDNRMALHIQGPEGAEIRVIDLGTGAVTASIAIQSE